MKLGTQIQFEDGRVATVVYNGLDGRGIKWGLWDPDPKDFEGSGPFSEAPPDFQWHPEAMLRAPGPGAEIECIAQDFNILRTGLGGAS